MDTYLEAPPPPGARTDPLPSASAALKQGQEATKDRKPNDGRGNAGRGDIVDQRAQHGLGTGRLPNVVGGMPSCHKWLRGVRMEKNPCCIPEAGFLDSRLDS